MSSLVANARMYSVAPGALAAWNRLFAWLERTSGVPLEVVEHLYPAKLDDLWRRDDLGCAFLCGWPWLRLGLGHRVIAAPVPMADYALGRPVYCTHFVVRADSAFEKLEDTFGYRFAYTIEDSHSGYNAPRRHLMGFHRPGGAPLFREIVGPLTTPRRMLEAIVEGRTDVGPLDSYAFDLLRRHEPALTAPVRVIASTPCVPIPAFMASAGTPPEIVKRLAAALCAFGDDPAEQAFRDDLCLTGFDRIDPAGYRIAEDWAREAEARGLALIS